MPKRTELPWLVIDGSDGLIGSSLARQLGRNHRLILLHRGLRENQSLRMDAPRLLLDPESPAAIHACIHQVASLCGGNLRAWIDLVASDGSTGPSAVTSPELFKAMDGRLSADRLVYSGSLPPRSDELPLPPSIHLRLGITYDERASSIPIARELLRIREAPESAFQHRDPRPQAFLHLGDLASAIRHMLDRQADFPDEIHFRLGEEPLMSWQELIERAGPLIHGRRWRQVIPLSVIRGRKTESTEEHGLYDLDFSSNLLDWKPSHSIREALPSMVAFLREDEARFRRVNRLPSERTWKGELVPWLALGAAGFAFWSLVRDLDLLNLRTRDFRVGQNDSPPGRRTVARRRPRLR